MLSSLVDWLFGCSHRHTSFPFTRRRASEGRGPVFYTETYVVCLDCGKRFDYDWAAMTLAKPPGVEAARRRAAAFQRLAHHT